MFRVGETVVEKKGFKRKGVVTEAYKEKYSNTGEWYHVEFPDGGVQGTSGESFEKDDSKMHVLSKRG